MKLHPPVPVIRKESPYSEDLFERREFGDSLRSIFTNIEEGLVISVDAAWGDGKTTFAKMWMADLQQNDIQCLYYDAFAHDYCDDPFVSFCAEIMDHLESSFTTHPEIRRLNSEFKDKAKQVGLKILCASTRIGVKALSLGLIKDSDIDSFESIREDIASESSLAASTLIERALDDYTSCKDMVFDFRQKLEKIGGAVRMAQQFPLLIIVDELDRCRPAFALSLIERIKHLFSVENVSFLLLVNMEQLQNFVKLMYGADVDARNYLHKFINVATTLPKDVMLGPTNVYSRYVQHLTKHYIPDRFMVIDRSLTGLFHFYHFSLREMEQCFVLLTIYYASLSKEDYTDDALICFLVVLKLKFATLFHRIHDNQASYQQVMDYSKIDQIDGMDRLRFSKNWLLNMLKCLLKTTDVPDSLDRQEMQQHLDTISFRYGLERNEILPMFCRKLNRFRIGA